MQKTALYRKYRPLTFSEVYGQDHITVTLRRQIASGAPGHAYLFTGTRGTGKTSCAKIFARAVNCLNPKDGEPCNECAVCRGIIDGSVFDVYEIDAASNTGVDNIRDIRDEITYAPIAARYKVYIIDEVHMLSTGAFNALLKTLEEPPEHVIFILATTEPHKVPATILSRCQRFDFFRLNISKITEILESVLKKEGKTLDKSSVNLVAELADGSVRDALSILDRVLELDTPEQIERSLGVLSREKLYSVAEYIADGNTEALYRTVDEMYSSSVDLTVFCDELTEVFRRVLVFCTTSEPKKSLDVSDDELVKLAAVAPRFSEQFLVYALRTLRQLRISVSRGADRRSETELCLLMLAKPSVSEDTEALTARIAVLEKEVAELKSAPQVYEKKPEKPAPTKRITQEVPREDKTAETEEKLSVKKTEEPEITAAESVKTAEEKPADDEWKELQSLDRIASFIKDMPLQMLMKLYVRAVYRGNDVVLIVSDQHDADTLNKNIGKIREAFEADHKSGRNITVERGNGTEKYIDPMTAYKNVESNPMFSFE